MNVKYKIILAMLVLAIFTVGCVSAEENVTVDMDVPTEETVVDDAVVEDVESEDATADEDVADEVENLRSGNTVIPIGSNSDDVNNAINDYDYVLFTTGTYYNMYNLTLKDGTTVDGNGSTLVGNGVDDIFLTNNCTNVVIKNFKININGAKHGINGAYVTNSAFKNNEIYNGQDGININKYYDNLTIADNNIYSVSRDAISLANPITYSDISSLGYTNISRNVITNTPYGIFIGGNFKGRITDNNISNNGEVAIQFAGKPNGQMGNIIGDISNNIILNGNLGIEFINETIVDLTMDSNTIRNMNHGINMVNITTDELDMSSNNISNMNKGITITNAILDGVTVYLNNIVNVNLGIGIVDTNIVDVTIESNYINTNTFANDYAILNDNVIKTGSLAINDNYLRGCINHSLELMANEFDDNTVFVIVY